MLSISRLRLTVTPCYLSIALSIIAGCSSNGNETEVPMDTVPNTGTTVTSADGLASITFGTPIDLSGITVTKVDSEATLPSETMAAGAEYLFESTGTPFTEAATVTLPAEGELKAIAFLMRATASDDAYVLTPYTPEIIAGSSASLRFSTTELGSYRVGRVQTGEAFFNARVLPNLSNCVNCHGSGDMDKPQHLLGPDPYATFKGWTPQTAGAGGPTSLFIPGDPPGSYLFAYATSDTHSGVAPSAEQLSALTEWVDLEVP